jgi:formylglycine-generating enzyme required for sulfatase activity/tRNA A-37 threonylcarbamoyl transferase component Bud32
VQIEVIRYENDMIGTQVKDYRIIQEIGKGGMASVFLVEHTMLHNQAALKLLNQEYVRNEHIRKRFLAEARSMARMSHTGVVKVTDLIEENDTVAFVMEYIEGETLKEYIDRKGKLKDDEIKTIFSQMLDAVGYVHEQNLVHRDIKPSNFMIDKKGKVKLMDFGIAKTLDASSSEYTQTGTGMQMGTPMYMSPEQITETKSVTAQSDIYSLGVVLWQLVTGQKPYDTNTLSSFQLQTKIVNDALTQTNTTWDAVIQKCTQKDIRSRFFKCAEISQTINTGSVKADSSDSTVVESQGANTKQEKPRSEINLEERFQQERERKGGADSQGSSRIKWVLIVGVLVLFSAVGYHFFIAGSGSSRDTSSTDKDADKGPEASPLGGALAIDWADIPAGTFTMGSPRSEADRGDEETQHEVTLDGFKMSKYEVTFEQYDAFCDATGRSKPSDQGWGRGKRPVINVSWDDAKAFATWAGAQLPTEAQWEYACRAGLQTPFNTGGCLSTNAANYDGNYPYGGCNSGTYKEKTIPVGNYAPNSWGLYDMHGNVWEWCSDWYGDYPSSKQTNPQGPSMGSSRVVRGGGWFGYAQYCRSACRNSYTPDARSHILGIRLVSPE